MGNNARIILAYPSLLLRRPSAKFRGFFEVQRRAGELENYTAESRRDRAARLLSSKQRHVRPIKTASGELRFARRESELEIEHCATRLAKKTLAFSYCLVLPSNSPGNRETFNYGNHLGFRKRCSSEAESTKWTRWNGYLMWCQRKREKVFQRSKEQGQVKLNISLILQ